MLRSRIEAIEAYEGFCRLLHEVLDRMRFLSTQRRPTLLNADDLRNDPRTSDLSAMLGGTIKTAQAKLTGSPIEIGFDGLARKFDGVRSGGDSFHAIWDHHVDVQKRKPPEGKRPWFEETVDGGLIIRPPYRANEEPEQRNEFVHPYRLFPVESFIRDLSVS